ncbi:response regulator transcription factor [Clostridium perfringens]|nr:response regulator transcription factor [Clostridium perfringens]
MKKILIIEDDLKIRKYMKKYLEGYDYEVDIIKSFENVIDEVLKVSADLIILDINLPKFDGFYFLKSIRKSLKTPVIIVSARSEEAEQIRGMEMGADDYVTKPFSMGLLLAKINAVLRRVKQVDNSIIKVEDLTLLCNSMELKVQNEKFELSRNEHKLLKILMNNYNKVITREELLEEIWDEDTFVDDNTLTVNITRLKKKLGVLGTEISIVTKRGIGYVLK